MKGSTPTSSQGSTEPLKLFWAYLTPPPLICGASAAFWPSCLLVFPSFLARASKSSCLSSWKWSGFQRKIFSLKQHARESSSMRRQTSHICLKIHKEIWEFHLQSLWMKFWCARVIHSKILSNAALNGIQKRESHLLKLWCTTGSLRACLHRYSFTTKRCLEFMKVTPKRTQWSPMKGLNLFLMRVQQNSSIKARARAMILINSINRLTKLTYQAPRFKLWMTNR